MANLGICFPSVLPFRYNSVVPWENAQHWLLLVCVSVVDIYVKKGEAARPLTDAFRARSRPPVPACPHPLVEPFPLPVRYYQRKEEKKIFSNSEV